jgi:hypothetical protein
MGTPWRKNAPLCLASRRITTQSPRKDKIKTGRKQK